MQLFACKTNPFLKSACTGELCVILLEFMNQVTNYFHVDSIELVVLDQNRKITDACM